MRGSIRKNGSQIGRPLVVVLVGFLLVASGPALADQEGLPERIRERLRKAGLDEVADVRVAVESGTVVLRGAALTLHALRAVEAAALEDSKIVENQLRVVPEERPESEIRKDVVRAVLGYAQLSIFDSVEYALDEGVLLLRGSVRHPYRKTDLERRLTKVSGVREIRNELKVQSVSLFDDRLRYQLARAIYGSDNFIRYAHRVNPPIRIIVDRGRVALTGMVASRVEQALLGHIARGFLAFSVDNRVQVDGDVPVEPAGRSEPTE